MICYDTMQLNVPKECVISYDKNKVEKWSYKHFKPSLFELKQDWKGLNEILIKFSAKILLDDYPKLINKDTIHQALYNINNLGVIELNIDKTINESSVSLCDVKKHCQGDLHTLKNNIIINMRDRINYNLKKPPRKDNLIFESNFETKSKQQRLTIYDKSKEIRLDKNKPFLNALQDRDAMLRYFEINNINVERNFKNVKQIKTGLNIKDTDLLTVLNANADPLKDMLEGTVKSINDIDFTNNENITGYDELNRLMIIEKLGGSMLAVEQHVKNNIDRKRKRDAELEKYYAVFEKWKKNEIAKIDLHKLVSFFVNV